MHDHHCFQDWRGGVGWSRNHPESLLQGSLCSGCHKVAGTGLVPMKTVTQSCQLRCRDPCSGKVMGSRRGCWLNAWDQYQDILQIPVLPLTSWVILDNITSRNFSFKSTKARLEQHLSHPGNIKSNNDLGIQRTPMSSLPSNFLFHFHSEHWLLSRTCRLRRILHLPWEAVKSAQTSLQN